MTVFVDTSAFYALFDQDDQNHDRAKMQLDDLLAREEDLVSTNYVLVETISLLQRRIGSGAVTDFENHMKLALRTIWVDESAHEAGMNALLLANRTRLSPVDCVSFTTMRRLNLATAFAFDRHFAEQGFECIP